MKYLLFSVLTFFLTFSLYANEDVVEIKSKGYTKEGNQYFLSIRSAYFPTLDPKILRRSSEVILKPFICKNCRYSDHQISCSKDRNPLEGDTVFCKDMDTLPQSPYESIASINCYGNICKLKVTTTMQKDNMEPHYNILYEMGDAEFIINENSQENINIQSNKQDQNVSQKDTSQKESTLSKLDISKNKCIKLGLEEKTEKFADCVLMFYQDE